MTPKTTETRIQNAIPNNNQLVIPNNTDNLTVWRSLYFEVECSTSARSQKEQQRDLGVFLAFLKREYGDTLHARWTPRVSKDFQNTLQKTLNEDGSRRWADRTINRMIAHLKTWSKWIHKHRPFPLGEPMPKIKTLAIGNQLDIEKAITKQERNHLLDAADFLLELGGRSKDRYRHYGERPPVRKGYRAYRNRAVIYALIETGMRRQAITKINIVDIDFKKQLIAVEEKGGSIHSYPISQQGLDAIKDYIEKERPQDEKKWQSPALFLTAKSNAHGNGRLTPQVINTVWKAVCKDAGVVDKTPHSARHGMGSHIIEKTGNISAVQRQLGHKNAAFSMQYSRITNDDLLKVLENR